MAQKVNSGKFVEFLQKCVDTGCGYIMGSKGQDPKKWAKDSWWLRNTRARSARKRSGGASMHPECSTAMA